MGEGTGATLKIVQVGRAPHDPEATANSLCLSFTTVTEPVVPAPLTVTVRVRLVVEPTLRVPKSKVESVVGAVMLEDVP